MKRTSLDESSFGSFTGKLNHLPSAASRLATAWLAVVLLLLLTMPFARAEIFWSVFAGKDTGIGTADGPGGFGIAARFEWPQGIALDASGNLYVTDGGNNTVRKITLPPNWEIGNVVTLAGQAGFQGVVDGTGLRAQFGDPQGVAVAANGDIYVADSDGGVIRKVTQAGVVTTWAGRAYQYGSTDGDRLAARFFLPAGLVFDPAGNLYVADLGNDTIRKISTTGRVTTIAGAAGQEGIADGIGTAARFRRPYGLTLDRAQNLYIADQYNCTIRKMTPAGVVTTIAGTPQAFGTTDGSRAQARFNLPTGIAVDAQGYVYVAEIGNTAVRVIAPDGTVSSLPPSIWNLETPGYPRQFNGPSGVAVDASGTLYVTDTGNHVVRRVKAGLAITYAGLPGVPRNVQDGIGNAARFLSPEAIVTDAAGNTYVADTTYIRKITAQGVVTTLAGSYISGERDGTGSAANFYYPSGLAVDLAGNLFVTDLTTGSIRKVTAAGVVTTFLKRDPNFPNDPRGIAIDRAGNLYVADTLRNVITKVTPAGVVTTLAGLSGVAGTADGVGSAARFNQPAGIAVDVTGTVFVSDTNNHTIRKITPTGIVTTLAGWVGRIGNTDGTGASAQFYLPRGLTMGLDGSLIVADTFNHLVRKVTMSGVVTTLGGYPGAGASNGSFYNSARFSRPYGVSVSPTGQIYVAEADSCVISTGIDGPGLGLLVNGNSLPVQGATVDFGEVRIPASSAQSTILVYNTGNTIFQNLAVQVVGANPGDFIVTQPRDPYIAYGGTTFNITFTPRATGPRTARVRFTSTGGGINAVEFAVTGTGILSPLIDFVTISSNNVNPSVANQGDLVKIRFHITGPVSFVNVAITRVHPLPPVAVPAYAVGGGYYEFAFGPYLLPPGQPISFYISAIDSAGQALTPATQTTNGTSVTVAPYPLPF